MAAAPRLIVRGRPVDNCPVFGYSGSCTAEPRQAQPDLPGYLNDEVENGFVWTEELGELLREFESNRDKYPTFESFFPEVVTLLNEYANKG